MKRHKGFTLIEVLLYLVLSSFVIIVSFNAVVTIQRQQMNIEKKSKQVMELYAAIASLTRDIEAAPCNKEQWIDTGPNRLVWKTNKKQIAWFIEKDALVRTEQRYREQGGWSRRSKSVIAHSITQFICAPLYEMKACVRGFRCTMQSGEHSVKSLIFLENRTIT